MKVRALGKIVGEVESGVFRKRIKEGPHLLHSKGNVPAIDANSFDTYEGVIQEIVIETEKRIFRVDKLRFTVNKQEIDFGYGRQYWMPKEHWEITERPQKSRLF